MAFNSQFINLNKKIIVCKKCKRLKNFREKIAKEKRKQYINENYWGKPITGFGDLNGKILLVGLAPAAHGGNRTGRVFTGDRSAEFLYKCLHKAVKRIKTGLILNEFGEQNKINVTEQEMQNEVQKQLRMMPGQEKLLQEYYQKNPQILENLRGQLYEEKILKEIKLKAKSTQKDISKEEAEKLLKNENKKHINENHSHNNEESKTKKATSSKTNNQKKTETTEKNLKKSKKVSKK